MRPSFLEEGQARCLAAGLHPRTKLVLCLASSVAAIVLSNPLALSLLAVAGVVYALMAMTPAGLVKAYIFIALVCLISLGFTALIAYFIPGLIKWEIGRFVPPYLRMAVTVNALLTLAFSTRIQDVMTELKSLGHIRWLHIPLTVAIRFLPTFLDDCSQIMDAYRLRRPLGRQGMGRRFFTAWRAFFVPLTFRLLRSADDLAMAAELKGIGADKPGQYERRPLGRLDAVILGSAIILLAVALTLQQQLGAPGFVR